MKKEKKEEKVVTVIKTGNNNNNFTDGLSQPIIPDDKKTAPEPEIEKVVEDEVVGNPIKEEELREREESVPDLLDETTSLDETEVTDATNTGESIEGEVVFTTLKEASEDEEVEVNNSAAESENHDDDLDEQQAEALFTDELNKMGKSVSDIARLVV